MASNWNPVISVAIAVDAPAGAPILLRGALSHTTDTAADIGFDGVELHFRHPDEIDWDVLAARLRARNLKLTSIGTGRIFTVDGLSLSDSRANNAEAAERRLEAMIDKASMFRADVIIGCARGMLLADGPAGRSAAYARLVAALKRLSAYAANRGCRLLVEPISRSEIDNINTVQQLLKLLDDIGSPNAWAHLDTYHLWMEDQDILASIKLAASRLGHIHFADSQRLAPEKGNLDFRSFLQTLRAVGYSGAIAFEYPPLPADECARRAQRGQEGPTTEEQIEAASFGLRHIRSLLDC